MSAESPRRGIHKGAQVVSPQPVSDRSIIESVAGIINDIVPQAYTGTPNVDNKETITWARFEYADVNDPALYPDYNEGSSTPPLLLVLGYGTGVQVWLVSASGEATEVLSWRQGVVRTLRFLPNPKACNEQKDLFQLKRPMVAICDSAGPGPQFCNIGFISLKTGEQVKSIKFKNPVNDVLANRKSVVVTFSEKIAVFDAKNLEDILTVTTCYLSPGPNSNPVALGTRWLAYSEKKLIPARRSSGGSEGEGAQSYTATVLHAAKSLGKGLRGLGETVASTLTGNSVTPPAPNNVGCDTTQPGVVTILDLQAAKEDKESDDGTVETVLAHFTAHSDAIVAMTFDLTGALLMTADRRGHDFHIFRIQSHPGGPTLAAVHHLYVLHRGDTTAKVQDMTFSSDARWAAVSTVRGTTHVFPIAPYGGPVGVRTHSTPHVVNRLSRFHRSAGLTADGTRSHSPVAHAEIPLSVYPYSNPRLPPYPHPTILHPLAQIRQPSTLNHVNNQPQPRPQQRQRLQSEDSGSLPLKICSCFAPQRAWIYAQRDTANKVIKRPVDSLFIMACHGNMIQYDLDPKPAAGVPKEKVCDDTTIELEVEAKGQWPLLRSANSLEILPPLPTSSPLLGISITPKSKPVSDSTEDQWLSQVEIVTHAGPHRRLWMGPQFIFKTYNAPSGVAVNLVEAEAIEVGVTGGSRPARSNPVNMPHAAARPLVPVVIDGSGSSYEQSPRFLEAYGDSLENESIVVGGGENQLREDLAEAMLETAAQPHRVPGRRVVVERMGQPVAKVVNPLGTVITISADEEDIVSSDSYETDSSLEPIRSLCAQEGPASLDDFRQESQPIKNLNEICAEMRTTSDLSIDSLANEDIKEVVETKALYAEPARLKSKGTVNFDEAEAFTDVQMTLNLCAEAGKIPTSPMTQAKENPWNKRTTTTERKLQEAKIARAKYVVNYDEETVVLTDNRPSKNQKTTTTMDETPHESGTSDRNINCIADKDVRERPKQLISKNATSRKKHAKTLESNTSNTDTPSFEPTPTEDHGGRKQKKSNETNTGENKAYEASQLQKQPETTVVVPRAVQDVQESSPIKEKSGKKKMKNKCKDVEKFESTFETIKDSEIHAISSEDLDPKYIKKSDHQVSGKVLASKTDAAISNESETTSPLVQSLHIDDVVSEYSILDKNESFDRHSVSSNHSDEDLEHIHTSEVTPVQACSNKFVIEKSGFDVDCDVDEMPGLQPNDLILPPKRKSSKAMSSDDDMEHIQSSDITEEYSRGITTPPKAQPDVGAVRFGKEGTKRKNSQKTAGKISVSPRIKSEDGKCPARSSARMEIVPCEVSGPTDESRVAEQEIFVNDEPRGSSIDKITAIEDSKIPEVPAKSLDADQAVESTIDVIKGKQKIRSNKNRKKKDDILVVVVPGEMEEKEAMPVRGTEDSHVWNRRNKSSEIDLAEEIDKCVEPTTGESAQSRRSIRQDSKPISNEPTSLDNIEIIDIDALRRAEAEFENDRSLAHATDPKVLELRPEVLLARPKKSKKSKKVVHADTGEGTLRKPSSLSLSKLKLLETEICQKDTQSNTCDTIQSETQIPANSWSSIVKKSKDECSVESCGQAVAGIKEFELETEVIQQLEETSVDRPKLGKEGPKSFQEMIENLTSEEDCENAEYLDPIVTTGKYKTLKSNCKSEEIPQLPGTYFNSISESQVAKNSDEGDDTLRNSEDINIYSDNKDKVIDDADDIYPEELEPSYSPLYSSIHETDILEHEYEQEQCSNIEQEPEEEDLELNADSSAVEREETSHVIEHGESSAKVGGTGEESPSTSRSSKEPSPEVESLPSKENDCKPEEAAGAEPQNFVDDSNANANVMDTEEDNSSKENVEKSLGNGSSSAKKGRSKKKRRR